MPLVSNSNSLFSLRLSSSNLRLLPRLPVPSIFSSSYATCCQSRHCVIHHIIGPTDLPSHHSSYVSMSFRQCSCQWLELSEHSQHRMSGRTGTAAAVQFQLPPEAPAVEYDTPRSRWPVPEPRPEPGTYRIQGLLTAQPRSSLYLSLIQGGSSTHPPTHTHTHTHTFINKVPNEYSGRGWTRWRQNSLPQSKPGSPDSNHV